MRWEILIGWLVWFTFFDRCVIRKEYLRYIVYKTIMWEPDLYKILHACSHHLSPLYSLHKRLE